jgi:hypothetical protein
MSAIATLLKDKRTSNATDSTASILSERSSRCVGNLREEARPIVGLLAVYASQFHLPFAIAKGRTACRNIAPL